jgi:hypothetical protein
LLRVTPVRARREFAAARRPLSVRDSITCGRERRRQAMLRRLNTHEASLVPRPPPRVIARRRRHSGLIPRPSHHPVPRVTPVAAASIHKFAWRITDVVGPLCCDAGGLREATRVGRGA